MAAAETFTTASLDAMRAYARGQDLVTQGEFELALISYEAAIEYDPEFGRAYAGMGVVYGNLREPTCGRLRVLATSAISEIDPISTFRPPCGSGRQVSPGIGQHSHRLPTSSRRQKSL